MRASVGIGKMEVLIYDYDAGARSWASFNCASRPVRVHAEAGGGLILNHNFTQNFLSQLTFTFAINSITFEVPSYV